MYVGITDFDWFTTLRDTNCAEVNFWKPGGRTAFKALSEGDLFLFKLHSPRDFIVGGGFFLTFSILPCSLAWEAFGISNGAKSYAELTSRVRRYRRDETLNSDPHIGCIILSSPFFLDEKHWIPVPPNWSKNIVQGKTYELTDQHGRLLYERVNESFTRQHHDHSYVYEHSPRQGKETIIRPRIGQGGFKVLITDAYSRKCAITAEKTLPVLEAAHIKPYSVDGPHAVSNGILLRRDFHTLFDRGYMTIDKSLVVHVSGRIKEDFGNGREYYAHHGQRLLVLPRRKDQQPDPQYLQWHNENVYLG